jgi:Uma2 family endonuclease
MATTEIETRPEQAAGADVYFPPHRITVDRFEKMIEAGVFGGPERVFLWDGRFYERMTPGISHIYVATNLRRMMDRIAPEGWYCLQEQPIVVGTINMPEPDISVVRGTFRDLRSRRMTTRDVSLVVEVSDSSLGFDSGAKLLAYAANGVPIYWIVNIPNQRIEVYSALDGDAYGEHRSYAAGEDVTVVLDGREVARIAVDDILP